MDGQKSFLIGSQNDEQKDFIAKHDTEKTLYIEGPYNIWMNHIKEQYYLLRSEALFIENPVSHEDDTRVREGKCVFSAGDIFHSCLPYWLYSLLYTLECWNFVEMKNFEN